MLDPRKAGLRKVDVVFGRRRKHQRSADVSEFTDEVRQLIAEQFAARTAFPIRPEELPAVVAVRTLIADTVADMPLLELGPDGRPTVVQSPIVQKPDPYEPAWLSHHRSTMDLTGDGNCWLHVTARNPLSGLPVAVTVLPSNEVTPIEETRTRRIIGCRWFDRTLSVDAGEVIHVPMNVTGRRGRLGESALRMSRPAVEAIAEIYKFSRSTWAEFGAPSVVLKMPGRPGNTVNDDGETPAEEVRRKWLDTHGGKRVPAVLYGGAEAEAFGHVTDHDKLAQALEIISADAPRAYRVPASLVNAYAASSSLTYTNVAHELDRWIKTGLRGYLMRLEAAYSEMLPRGHRAKFDTTALSEPTFLERCQALALALGPGQPWLDRPEARQMMGLDPTGTTSRITTPSLEVI
jgi:phage portal protein BeeE